MNGSCYSKVIKTLKTLGTVSGISGLSGEEEKKRKNRRASNSVLNSFWTPERDHSSHHNLFWASSG